MTNYTEKIISICLSGRNDGYGHDFLRRFEQSMNFLAFSAEKAGVLDQIEVLFTDWNVESPMVDAVRLSQAAASLLSFIEVPPAFARQHNFENTPFHSCKSLNVALRRANGTYVTQCPADILITSYSIKTLVDILTRRLELPFAPSDTLMCIPRRVLPFYCREQNYFDDGANTERILALNNDFIYEDNVPRGICGGYGAVLLSRQLTHKLRGVNESFGGWGGADIDFGLRAGCHVQTVNLSGFGVTCYDFEPSKKMVREKSQRETKYSPTVSSMPINSPDWGFPGENFKISKPAPRAFALAKTKATQGFVDVDNLLSPEFRIEVLMRSRTVGAKHLRRISSEAIVLANLANQLKPKCILLVNCDTPTIAITLSLFAPMTNLFIASSQAGNLQCFSQLGDALRNSRHVGETHFLPLHIKDITPSLLRDLHGRDTCLDLVYWDLTHGADSCGNIADKLRPLLTTNCAVVIKCDSNSVVVQGAVAALQKMFQHKTVLTSQKHGVIICANTDAAETRREVNPSSARRAWASFDGNIIAMAILKLNINWTRPIKASRILARVGITSIFSILPRLIKI
jgi:hypothetical protein